MAELSEAAWDFLSAAVKSDDGKVKILEVFNDFMIIAGDKRLLMTGGDPRLRANGRATLEELRRAGLIQRTKRQSFEVTKRGYEYYAENRTSTLESS